MPKAERRTRTARVERPLTYRKVYSVSDTTPGIVKEMMRHALREIDPNNRRYPAFTQAITEGVGPTSDKPKLLEEVQALLKGVDHMRFTFRDPITDISYEPSYVLMSLGGLTDRILSEFERTVPTRFYMRIQLISVQEKLLR